jgi:hypothetical protein
VGVIGVAFFPERKPVPPPVVRRPIARPAPLPYDEYRPRFDPPSMNDGAAPSGPPMQHPRSAPTRSPSPAPAAAGGGASEPRRETAPAKRAAQAGAARDEVGQSGRINNLGTEFGETRESVVSSVAFERASPSHPALVVSVRYDDADGLSARGIDLSVLGYAQRLPVRDEPEAFPVSRFAQPPP